MKMHFCGCWNMVHWTILVSLSVFSDHLGVIINQWTVFSVYTWLFLEVWRSGQNSASSNDLFSFRLWSYACFRYLHVQTPPPMCCERGESSWMLWVSSSVFCFPKYDSPISDNRTLLLVVADFVHFGDRMPWIETLCLCSTGELCLVF